MGTSGLVGQIGTFSVMGFHYNVFINVLLLHFILPAVITIIAYKVLYNMGKIKTGDCKLNI